MRSSIAISFPILILMGVFGFFFLIMLLRGIGQACGVRSRGEPMSFLGSVVAVLCFVFLIPLVLATLFFASAKPARVPVPAPQAEIIAYVTEPRIGEPVLAPRPTEPQPAIAPPASQVVTKKSETKTSVTSESMPPRTIVVEGGYYKSRDDAFNDAVEKARDAVAAQLERYGFSWQPSPKDIERIIVHQVPIPYPIKNPENPEMEDMKKVELTLALGNKDIAVFKQQERGMRAQDRVTLLAKVIAGMVALLLTIGGYVRLDEMSKGYYSGWLRMGAVAAAAAFTGLAMMTF